MTRISNVATELIAHPEKIQGAEISVQGEKFNNYGINCKELILDEHVPTFPDEIKSLGDIPKPWLWAVLKKKVPTELLDKNIQLWMNKSHKPFKICFGYMTGLDIN